MNPWHRDWFHLPSDGEGLTVGVIDTGSVGHPVAAFRSFVPGVSDPTGHGTAAVGLVADLAPRARLVVARAIGDDLAAADEHLAAALAWVVDAGARIVVIGAGRPRAWGAPPDPTWIARARAAWDAGVLVLAPVGNGSRPGRPEAVREPAACRPVVGVGAVDRQGTPLAANAADDGVAPVALLAPGVGVSAPFPDGRRVEITGTSAAAAVAAGWAAAVAGATSDPGPAALLAALRVARAGAPS